MLLKVRLSSCCGDLPSVLSAREAVSHPIGQPLFPLGWHTSHVYNLLVVFSLLQPASRVIHTRVLELLLVYQFL